MDGSQPKNIIDSFLNDLEESGRIARKDADIQTARRGLNEAATFFERIECYLENIRGELDPFTDIGPPSEGWAHGAFRESMRVIELTIDAFCNTYGLHVHRANSTGVRKSIASFLLEVDCEPGGGREPRASGEIRINLNSGNRIEGVRRGRHAVNCNTETRPTAEDLIWLRRHVKYPGTDIPHDDLRFEIERALSIAKSIHQNFIQLVNS